MQSPSSKLLLVTLLLFLLLPVHSYSQVTVTGPSCVLPGVEYQYVISGSWADNPALQACVQGGVLADSTTCYNGAPVGFVRLVWNGQDTNSSLNIHSSIGDTVFTVTLTSQLQGGVLDSSVKYQASDTASIPLPISCSDATGGNCSPAYIYQWQQSTDNLAWTDMDGATSSNLNFTTANTQTMYYRRKVTETISNSTAYSDVAMVIIQSNGN